MPLPIAPPLLKSPGNSKAGFAPPDHAPELSVGVVDLSGSLIDVDEVRLQPVTPPSSALSLSRRRQAAIGDCGGGVYQFDRLLAD